MKNEKPMTVGELKKIAEKFLDNPILGTFEATVLCQIATLQLEEKNRFIINVPSKHGLSAYKHHNMDYGKRTSSW